MKNLRFILGVVIVISLFLVSCEKDVIISDYNQTKMNTNNKNIQATGDDGYESPDNEKDG